MVGQESALQPEPGKLVIHTLHTIWWFRTFRMCIWFNRFWGWNPTSSSAILQAKKETTLLPMSARSSDSDHSSRIQRWGAVELWCYWDWTGWLSWTSVTLFQRPFFKEVHELGSRTGYLKPWHAEVYFDAASFFWNAKKSNPFLLVHLIRPKHCSTVFH